MQFSCRRTSSLFVSVPPFPKLQPLLSRTTAQHAHLWFRSMFAFNRVCFPKHTTPCPRPPSTYTSRRRVWCPRPPPPPPFFGGAGDPGDFQGGSIFGSPGAFGRGFRRVTSASRVLVQVENYEGFLNLALDFQGPGLFREFRFGHAEKKRSWRWSRNGHRLKTGRPPAGPLGIFGCCFFGLVAANPFKPRKVEL